MADGQQPPKAPLSGESTIGIFSFMKAASLTEPDCPISYVLYASNFSRECYRIGATYGKKSWELTSRLLRPESDTFNDWKTDRSNFEVLKPLE